MVHSGFGQPCTITVIVLKNGKFHEAWVLPSWEILPSPPPFYISDFVYSLWPPPKPFSCNIPHSCLSGSINDSTNSSDQSGRHMTCLVTDNFPLEIDTWLRTDQSESFPGIFYAHTGIKMLSFAMVLLIWGSKSRAAYSQLLNLYRP